MITKGQVAGNPKEAAEMIAVLTKEGANLRGVLRSARRYVDAYAANANNHPQARDLARELLGQIDAQLD